jgi:predicted dehydrogenase
MRKIKIGILGAGRAGWGIGTQELLQMPEKYEIVAACDIIPSRCEMMKKEVGCRTYSTLDEMLKDTEIEAVYVATRSSDHFEHGMKTLRAGKIAIMEKPVTSSYNDAITLFKEASLLGKNRIFVHQQRRFEGLYEKFKSIIASGKLGEVFEINLEQSGYQHRDDWQTIDEYGGGQLLNWGPHLIDHSLQLIGTHNINITSYLQHTVAAGDCEDHLKIRFIGDNGRVINTTISGGTAICRGRYYEALGTKGHLIVTENDVKIKYLDPENQLPVPVANPETPGEMAFGASGTFAAVATPKWIDEAYPLSNEERSFVRLRVFWDYLYDSIVNGADFPIKDSEVLEIMRTISLCKTQSTYNLKERYDK